MDVPNFHLPSPFPSTNYPGPLPVPVQQFQPLEFGAKVEGPLSPPSLGGRLIYFSPEFLTVTSRNLTNKVQREQENNAIVGSACLQKAVLTILGLKDAFRSLLSKGDDITLLTNFNKCILELQQANTPKVSSHALGWTVTEELPWITDISELFEHCIKTIREFGPLLMGRKGVSTLEFFSQAVLWKGWKQQSLQIDVNNNSLGALLEKCKERRELPVKIFNEIFSFHQSISYVTKCYQNEEHPTGMVIAGIYEQWGVQLIIPNHLDVTLEVKGPQITKPPRK